MHSFYSLIQYAPDSRADERLNAGVVTYVGDEVRVKFVEHWDRLRHFGGGDISFLRDFAEEFAREVKTESMIRKWAAGGGGCIRITPPRGSLLGVDDLLAFCEERFLAGDREWSALTPWAGDR